MKLLRIRKDGNVIPAILVSEEKLLDCSSITADFDGEFYESEGISKLEAALKANTLPVLEASPEDADSSIPRPGKIVCIGLNYSDHAKEAGMAEPDEPIIFMKATSALSGPFDPIRKPRAATELDWEVELGIVIGKTARYLESEEEALSHVAGYTVANDVSERAFQLKHGGQWTKGKSHDTFCPTGPWLVTPDEAGDPQNLQMTLSVNGETMQNGNTKTMIFPVSKIIHYLSQYMTLEAGDLIITGTPPGVGAGMVPQKWLQVGDVVSLSIEGLGTQTQTVIADE
ncbi:fumarylacetoacetate hydrolase family protein [Pelagicoccus mobilis]|uniref:Fumarylacetoacetate hydrolase family protein n=1 Tax=Pelagicoccus mobilis TaxID=415221 RepID=A0A934VSX0_9BACT|nr:fumarylacetoacetate hydrolase family protein [Pelagicoccus mobilis]MBK1879098.1 fumarylacetoacetate hydrolase family protein [Pelagicoccus mobilis]